MIDRIARRYLASRIDYSRVDRIQEAPWVKTRYAGKSWFSTAVQIWNRDGSRQSGFGTDRSPARAGIKALAEALERDTIAKNQMSGGVASSGVAMGLGQTPAAKRAHDELVERDAYLRWTLGLTDVVRVLRDDTSVSLQFRSEEPSVVVAGVADLTNNCLPFGLGTGPDWESARLKATAELVASLVRHQNQGRTCEQGGGTTGGDSQHQRLHLLTLNPTTRAAWISGKWPRRASQIPTFCSEQAAVSTTTFLPVLALRRSERRIPPHLRWVTAIAQDSRFLKWTPEFLEQNAIPLG